MQVVKMLNSHVPCQNRLFGFSICIASHKENITCKFRLAVRKILAKIKQVKSGAHVTYKCVQMLISTKARDVLVIKRRHFYVNELQKTCLS